MLVRDLMEVDVIKVAPETPVQGVARIITQRGAACALVNSADGHLLGIIAKSDILRLVSEVIDVSDITAQEIMTPYEELTCIRPDAKVLEASDVMSRYSLTQLPVTENGRLLGLITRDTTLAYYWKQELSRLEQEIWERRAGVILKSLHDGLIVVDQNLIIQEFNDAACALTGYTREERIGRKAEVVSREASPVFDVLASGKPRFNVETPLNNGSTWLCNFLPLIEEGQVTGVVQTFQDITNRKRLEAQLVAAKDELEKAFALTLPNSRVEYKLKSTPEYRDTYDPETGLIRIMEIIPDGNYLHVVNALKVAADLNEKGVMQIIGINKDDLVQAIIFHDLGKAQPELAVGSVVDPKEVFEDGRYHAARSADMAAHFYKKNSDVVNLIRYHHHSKEEIPDEFPRYLMPMLRLFKIVDGLSACLTRRDGRVELDKRDSWIQVTERNNHPDFSRRWELNLLTGETRVLEHFPADIPPLLDVAN